MVDLTAVLTPETPRDIETITAEVLELKQTAGGAILAIGQRLTEAKSILPHGEWLPWLNERVEFSERAAQNFMRLSREWSNPQALADLGQAKALTLLALPEAERETFLSQAHDVGGEEKTVIDMTSRELEKAVRERKEALAAKEQAEAAARTAEAARARMEQDMAALKRLLDSANSEKAEAQDTVLSLEKQLQELEKKPVEVAMAVVDQEALDKAKAEARAEMEDKLARAKEQKARADEKRKDAEEALAAARAQLEAAQRAQKQAAISNNKELATFAVYLQEIAELGNKMRGVILLVRGRGEDETASKLAEAARAAFGRELEGVAK